MRALTGLWRWRRNPLRRTTDLVEAWIALAAALLLVLGAPLAGWVSGSLIDSSLQRTVQVQQQDRHHSTAVMIADSTEHVSPGFYDPDSTAQQGSDARVIAQWKTADGAKHVATVTAPHTKLKTGDTFGIWSDTHGTQVPPPMNGTMGHFHAVFVGIISACLAAIAVIALWRLAIWRLMARRFKRLDRQWAQVGPDWGRTGTGS